MLSLIEKNALLLRRRLNASKPCSGGPPQASVSVEYHRERTAYGGYCVSSTEAVLRQLEFRLPNNCRRDDMAFSGKILCDLVKGLILNFLSLAEGGPTLGWAIRGKLTDAVIDRKKCIVAAPSVKCVEALRRRSLRCLRA